MTRKSAEAVGKSVRRQLLVIAKERGDDFNLVVIRYCLERFLYRLSISRHRDDFILKGAMLFTLWSGESHRATRDLDLLGHGAADQDRLRDIFTQICGTACEDDGVTFISPATEVSDIRADTQYRGLRVMLTCELDTITNLRLQIDFGFGDAVVPAAEEATFPPIIDLPAPRLRVYPREVVVAGKTQAMVKLGIANSRMKDFYDIHFLASNFPFSGNSLSAALVAAFAQRQTPAPATLPLALTTEFSHDALKMRQWEGFLRRARLPTQSLTLPNVVGDLKNFLAPPLQAASKNEAFDFSWSPGGIWQCVRLA